MKELGLKEEDYWWWLGPAPLRGANSAALSKRLHHVFKHGII